jgi:hypothetical protein
MSNELVPFKDTQPSQISIFQQSAIGLVTSLVPTRSLTALEMNISSFLSLWGGFWSYSITVPEQRALSASI